jgi:hypothetical protein
VHHAYTDNDPVKKPLSQEEAFKPIRNALIKEANALGAQLRDLEEVKPEGEDAPVQISEPTPHHDSPKAPATHPPTANSAKPTATRAGVVATSVARFGNSLSRTLRNNFYNQADKSPMSVDSRLQREIEAKKKGQNLSM